MTTEYAQLKHTYPWLTDELWASIIRLSAALNGSPIEIAQRIDALLPRPPVFEAFLRLTSAPTSQEVPMTSARRYRCKEP
jgi:hypothetical protein